MTQEEVAEGSKLIITFMGGNPENRNYRGNFASCKYHSSWDWLVPVILEVNGKHSPLVLFHPYDILKEFEVTVGRIKLRNKALKAFK